MKSIEYYYKLLYDSFVAELRIESIRNHFLSCLVNMQVNPDKYHQMLTHQEILRQQYLVQYNYYLVCLQLDWERSLSNDVPKDTFCVFVAG